jgi:hypothetical protein
METTTAAVETAATMTPAAALGDCGQCQEATNEEKLRNLSHIRSPNGSVALRAACGKTHGDS